MAMLEIRGVLYCFITTKQQLIQASHMYACIHARMYTYTCTHAQTSTETEARTTYRMCSHSAENTFSADIECVLILLQRTHSKFALSFPSCNHAVDWGIGLCTVQVVFHWWCEILEIPSQPAQLKHTNVMLGKYLLRSAYVRSFRALFFRRR